MRNLIRHISQSLSWKLSLGILLMAIPIFVVSIGILFVHSREKVKKEATMHAASVVNTTMQHITRFMDMVETATDVNDWQVMREITRDGQWGAIYKSDDAQDGARVMADLIRNNNLYKQQAKQTAIQVRQTFSIEQHIARLYELYQTIN